MEYSYDYIEEVMILKIITLLTLASFTMVYTVWLITVIKLTIVISISYS